MHPAQCMEVSVCMLVIGSFYLDIHVTKYHFANKINNTAKSENENFYHEIICFGFFHFLSNFFSLFFSASYRHCRKLPLLLLNLHRHSRRGKRTKKKILEKKSLFSDGHMDPMDFEKKIECTH